MPQLEKNQHTKLNVTQKAQHRVMVGLGWDPSEGGSIVSKIGDVMKGKKLHHDLDLACFIYDKDLNLLEHISALGKACDESGKIYHSGDNVEGFGEGDDEEISVELKDLPETIHHLVFTAEIKTGQDFTEVLNPAIRLADGYSNYDFLSCELNKEKAKGCEAYIFAQLYRDGEDWNTHFIDSFINIANDPTWQETIAAMLKS